MGRSRAVSSAYPGPLVIHYDFGPTRYKGCTPLQASDAYARSPKEFTLQRHANCPAAEVRIDTSSKVPCHGQTRNDGEWQ